VKLESYVEQLCEGICPICRERFEDREDLYEHLLEHSDEGDVIADEFLEELREMVEIPDEQDVTLDELDGGQILAA